MVNWYRILIVALVFISLARCVQAEDLTARLAVLQAAQAPRPSEAGGLPRVTVVPGLDVPPNYTRPTPANVAQELDAAMERQRRFDAEDAADAARAAQAEAEDDQGKLTVTSGSELSRFNTGWQFRPYRRHRR